MTLSIVYLKEVMMTKLETLRVYRTNKGLSRRELALKSGVKEETIKALELGINNPMEAKLSTILKLSKALGIKPHKLYPDYL